jgi:hypothetical protein
MSTNPIEGGVEQAYQEIRSSLELIMNETFKPISDDSAIGHSIRQTLLSLDDAVSNNFEELMDAFWLGVGEDVANSTKANTYDHHIDRQAIYGGSDW